MAGYVYRGSKTEPRRIEGIPPLAEHERRRPRTWSFYGDEDSRRAAKQETNTDYYRRNRDRVNAKRREEYARRKALTRIKQGV